MVKLHDMDVDDYLADCVNVEPTCIQEDFVRVPADMAYWGAKHAAAHKANLMAKLEFDRVEARVSIGRREQMAAAGIKVTEKMLESAVVLDDLVHAARLAVIETEAELVQMRNVLSAVCAKKDMVVSIGAHVRAEMERDPIIRSMHQAASARRGVSEE